MIGRFVQLTLKWKLILSFAAVAMLFAGTAFYQGTQTKEVKESMVSQQAEMENRITVAKITQLLQEMNGLENSLAQSSDLEAVDTFAEKQQELLDEMAALHFAADSEPYRKLQQLHGQAEEYIDVFNDIVAAMNDEDMDPLTVLENIDTSNTKALEWMPEMLNLNDQLYDAAADNADRAQSHSFAMLNRTMSISRYTAILVVLFTVTVAFLLIRSFLVPVARLQSALRKISEGDLRHRLHSSSNDELGRLSDHFDHMVDRVRDMLKQTHSVASSLAEHSHSFQHSSSITAHANQEIVKTIQEISVGAEQQAGQTEQSASLIQELHKEIQDIAKYTETMLTTSDEANLNARSGAAAVNELQQASRFSRDSIGKVYEALSRLTELSQNISRITNSITQVSNQTNILALNAAIEAARAGTHGKGFAVIAEEVRLLSVQTKESSAHIGVMIDELHNGMEIFQTNMLETRASLEKQDDRVAETLSSFAAIDRSIQEIGKQIGQVHLKLDATQARNAILAETVQNVASIAEETAAGVQEVNASSIQQDHAVRDIARQADDIHQLSQRLYHEINAFKIEEETTEPLANKWDEAGDGDDLLETGEAENVA